MGVGHAAVALAATGIVRRVNVGWLIFAALLADFALGVFALVGLEQAHIPADYARRHYLTFTFPYSHGLMPLLVYGVAAGFLISRSTSSNRTRTLLIVAAVVVSHFVLDAMVHVVGLPLAGEASPKIGLGLWNHLPLELGIETMMSLVGVIVYLKVAGVDASAVSRWGIPIFMLVFTALTWTQLFSTRPPTRGELLVSWIVATPLFSAIAYWLDRRRVLAFTSPRQTLR